MTRNNIIIMYGRPTSILLFLPVGGLLFITADSKDDTAEEADEATAEVEFVRDLVVIRRFSAFAATVADVEAASVLECSPLELELDRLRMELA